MTRNKIRLSARAALVGLLCSTVVVSGVLGHAELAAETEPDIRGEWGFGFTVGGTSGPTFLCIASLIPEQSGLSNIMSCEIGFVQLAGTRDKADGTFSLSGQLWDRTLSMTGTFDSPESYYPADGTWTLEDSPGGTFVGVHALFGRGIVRCPTEPFGPFPGRQLSSIDALLILQYVAGLAPSLPCRYLGDVNVDGDITAEDAALVLEYTARLIEHFPPF